MAQRHLRHVRAYLEVPLVGQLEVLIEFHDGLMDADGHMGDDGTRKFLQGFVDRYVAWVCKFM